MNIFEATDRYEHWMASQIAVVRADLDYKHSELAKSPLTFLRGTFYRWAQVWPELCADCKATPVVLGIGDVHTENFGTWRDTEGRLIWGVNDFDEAQSLPYTVDLVRLAASALLKGKFEHLSLAKREICNEILDGYADSIRSGGKPFVLDEENAPLRELALGKLRPPAKFWKKMRDLPPYRKPLSTDQREALECLLPEKGVAYQVKTRRSGVGSLGRQRLVALANWRGGLIAREAKAILPSAADGQLRYDEIVQKSVRVLDPCVRREGNWIVRRLAPDCSRIELSSLPEAFDEAQLLYAMGFETANIHLGSADSIKKIRKDLDRRTTKWLRQYANAAAKFVVTEWKNWRSRFTA